MNVIPTTGHNNSNIPENIMLCLLWKECIYNIIQYLKTNIESQDDLDKGYEELIKSVISEIDKYLRLTYFSKKVRKMFKYYKCEVLRIVGKILNLLYKIKL